MSNKTEVLSFDDWAKFQGLPLEKDDNGLYVNRHTHYARKGWEAKPEKAEIDELQKRIDEISNHVEINYDENRDDDSHSYWSGYNQALRELFEILKGEETK